MIAGRETRRARGISHGFGVALVAATLASVSVSAARAGDCNTDIAALSQKRQAFIERLNQLAKSTSGKLDPIASCPALQGLVKAEGALLRYLQANTTWCNIPDETVANLKAGAARSVSFEGKACAFAAQAKKAQAAQAATGAALAAQAQKLPAGPL
jgi:hypothetical protein